jgi:Flp pilus assembly protein TadG
MKLNRRWNCDDRGAEGFRRAARKAAPRSEKASGQAMLELCLILPVLLLLILGTIEFGRAAYFDIEVADAARAGALYGAQSMADAADTGAITQAVQNNAQDIPTAQMTITPSVSCTCPGSGTVAGSCAGALGCTPQVYVSVYVQDRQPTLFQYPGIPDPFTLTTTAVMPVRIQ